MKIDFSAKITDLSGVQIKEESGKEMTLASACCTALLANFQDEQNLDGATKIKRYRIAEKIVDGGEQDLSAEQISELKKLIAKAYGPLVVGKTYDLLDPGTLPNGA